MLQTVINNQTDKDFYTVGAATNLDNYGDLYTFKNVNQIEYPLATNLELGNLSVHFDSDFVFIGKNNKIIGSLKSSDTAEEMDDMLKRTMASFYDIYLLDHPNYFMIENGEKIIALDEIFQYNKESYIDFQVVNSTDDQVSTFEISGDEIHLLKGSKSGNTDLTLIAKVPDKNIWVKTKFTVINNNSALIENFEYDFLGQSSINWNSGGDADWKIIEEKSFSGKKSLRSGFIDHEQNSEISVNLNLSEPGTVSFAYKTSTYYDYYLDQIDGDFLYFFIDSTNVSSSENLELWGGVNDWRFVSYEIPEGEHTLRWQYLKNDWAFSDEDVVMIDFIILPGSEFMTDAQSEKLNPYNISLNIYPNPFNPVTSINFQLEKDQFVKLYIYDSKGSLVEKLAENTLNAGTHSLFFKGEHLSTGVYYVFLETEMYQSTNKIMLIK